MYSLDKLKGWTSLLSLFSHGHGWHGEAKERNIREKSCDTVVMERRISLFLPLKLVNIPNT